VAGPRHVRLQFKMQWRGIILSSGYPTDKADNELGPSHHGLGPSRGGGDGSSPESARMQRACLCISALTGTLLERLSDHRARRLCPATGVKTPRMTGSHRCARRHATAGATNDHARRSSVSALLVASLNTRKRSVLFQMRGNDHPGQQRHEPQERIAPPDTASESAENSVALTAIRGASFSRQWRRRRAIGHEGSAQCIEKLRFLVSGLTAVFPQEFSIAGLVIGNGAESTRSNSQSELARTDQHNGKDVGEEVGMRPPRSSIRK
jgi:hypothetical protein